MPRSTGALGISKPEPESLGKASKTVCASHRGSQWCAQDLREGQVMIGRRWISRGRSPTMISFFLRVVGLEKAVL